MVFTITWSPSFKIDYRRKRKKEIMEDSSGILCRSAKKSIECKENSTVATFTRQCAVGRMHGEMVG